MNSGGIAAAASLILILALIAVFTIRYDRSADWGPADADSSEQDNSPGVSRVITVIGSLCAAGLILWAIFSTN